jgi:hypothetical protein
MTGRLIGTKASGMPELQNSSECADDRPKCGLAASEVNSSDLKSLICGKPTT